MDDNTVLISRRHKAIKAEWTSLHKYSEWKGKNYKKEGKRKRKAKTKTLNNLCLTAEKWRAAVRHRLAPLAADGSARVAFGREGGAETVKIDGELRRNCARF